MQRTSTNTSADPRVSTSARDALAGVASSEDDARKLYVAVREALRGRGGSRRKAENVLLARASIALVPAVLAVRDDLAREASPPRGLAGRADQLLLRIASKAAAKGDSATGKPAPRRAERPARRTQATVFSGPGARAGSLLRHVLDLAPDALLTIRASGRVGIWNAAGAEITGRRRRDLLRTGVGTLFKEPETLTELVAELERHGSAEPRETVLLRPGGEEIPVRVFAAPFHSRAHGRDDPEQYLLFLHDLTEVHQIRSRLIDTEKLSAMAKIAGSVAHEFRNPLNSLFLSADLLEDELEGQPGAGEAIAPTLAAIREEIERLNQIIIHYLALSKVESSTPELIDLGETVRAFVEEWREHAGARGIDLKVSVHAGELAVSADLNQVRRILVNLVENAFDALTGDEGEGRDSRKNRLRGAAVKLTVRPMRRSVKLTVKDNGPGIPADVRGRVFDPFFTSKSRGSGLGLYLVREIVLAHGGAISLAANGGRGTTVVMHWPYPENGD